VPPKSILFSICALLSWSICVGQKTDSNFTKTEVQYEVNAFIKGYQFENGIDKDILKNDFELGLSDTSYVIVHFSVSWEIGESIYVRTVTGNHVSVTGNFGTLTQIDTGTAVVFDNIVIRKGQTFYWAPAFIAEAITSAQADAWKKDLAPCLVYIVGYKNNNTAPYTIFANDLLLQSSDPSYSIKSFVVSWDRTAGDWASATFQGNKLTVEQNNNSSLFTDLRPGSTITIDGIKVEKDGKIYKVKPVVMYLR